MPQNIHLEMVSAETERRFESSAEMEPNERAVRSNAADLSRTVSWLPGESRSPVFVERCRDLAKALKPVLKRLEARSPGTAISDDSRWLYDNVHLLSSELANVCRTFKHRQKMPLVRTSDGAIIPRVVVLAEAFLAATVYQFCEKTFAAYLDTFQQQTVLKTKELWMLIPALKLVLLEKIADRGSRAIANPTDSYGIGVCVRSLRDVTQVSWKDLLEPLILLDHILREDPVGAYSRMDFDSRDLYRNKLADIAEHSDFSEMEVANEVLVLAQSAQQRKEANPRVGLRCSHVGYYLLGEGVPFFTREWVITPPFYERISSLLRRYPDEFYLTTMLLVTLPMMSAMVLLLIDPHSFARPHSVLDAGVVSTLLASCDPTDNYFTTSLLRPQILPKLDLSEGIPDDCMTLVAVPTLLLNEKQVRGWWTIWKSAFWAITIRNMHFALLTDLPDSRRSLREADPLVDFAVRT